MPPITPPEKRPDRHYNFGRMNMWFAVSALALLATTLWMVVADYAQPWKRFQAEFRDLEREQLRKELQEESGKIEDQRKQLQAEIRAAEKALGTDRDEIAKLEDRVRELTSKWNQADADWRGAKARLDEARFLYDQSIQAGQADAKKRDRVEEERKALLDAQAEREGYGNEREKIQARIAERRKAVTAAEEKLAALQGGVESLETRAAALAKDPAYFLLNAPLMDFVKPTLSVQQVILPGLTHNINFTEINRVDRCVTCHVAANRPGFDGEEWKEPYRSHPRLEEFVGDSSPHPYTQFG
ncbi:MAG TPA: hypothetical protein VF414_18655, partial [Thermoanaerobaculia bacterium]